MNRLASQRLVKQDDLNSAVERLSRLDRRAAGEAALEYATSVLRVAAQYTPADLAALGVLSAALYYAAATQSTEVAGIAALRQLIDERYVALLDEAPIEDVFRASLVYPENLENYLRALSVLPRSVVAAGLASVRDALTAL